MRPISYFLVLFLLAMAPAAQAQGIKPYGPNDGVTKVTIDSIELVEGSQKGKTAIKVTGKVYISKTEKEYKGLAFKVRGPTRCRCSHRE